MKTMKGGVCVCVEDERWRDKESIRNRIVVKSKRDKGTFVGICRLLTIISSFHLFVRKNKQWNYSSLRSECILPLQMGIQAA